MIPQDHTTAAASLPKLCADAANGKPVPSLPDRLLTLADVGARLQVGRTTVWQMMNAKPPLRRVKFGKVVRVFERDLEAFLQRHTEGQA
ncbi:MAG: helix-turn-helix domain-containing protein [Verrucomicrobia bacterium]|nr:helix-turn-helix domain-containing protein [Verrucomicrobiota bacterium]